MIALDDVLAGLSPDEQISALLELRYAIQGRLQAAAAARVLELVPAAVSAEWVGDTSSNDDGTSTPYVSKLALVVADERIELPVEGDLGCGVEWYEGMCFSGFPNDEAEEAFLDTLEAAMLSANRDERASAEDLALAQIALSLGVAVDVPALIGALTILAEEEPFAESHALTKDVADAPREPCVAGA